MDQVGIGKSKRKFRMKPVEVRLTVNHVGGYTDNLNSTAIVPVKSFTPVDLRIGWDVKTRGPLGGLNFAIEGRNIFDTIPPHVNTSGATTQGFDPTAADPLGREISFVIRKKW
jgi:iron complex outermembrane receptor protein